MGSERDQRLGKFSPLAKPYRCWPLVTDLELEAEDWEPLRRLCNFATILRAVGWELQAKLQDGKAA